MSDSENSDIESSPESQLEARHRREMKEFRAKIQQMKKQASSGSKQAKKDTLLEISRLETEITSRHQKELDDLLLAANLHSISIKEDRRRDLDPSCDHNHHGSNDDLAKETRKPSKQQLRKQKKQAEINRMRQEAIEESKNIPDLKKIESDAITAVLDGMKLRIHEIAADGHCMYSAIAHQLSIVDGRAMDYLAVRKLAAEEMRSHSDDYLPYLINDHGDMLQPSEYSAYCDKVESSGEWGGHVELAAISNSLKRQIIVVQASSAPVVIGAQFPAGETSFQLSYHKHAYGLGEHYNSLTE